MAEAEDVIVDVARHATSFVQGLWQRHRAQRDMQIDLPALLQRLDLLVTAAMGVDLRLQLAQPPLPAPLIRRFFRPYERPAARQALPATDGYSIWLPTPASCCDPAGGRRPGKSEEMSNGYDNRKQDGAVPPGRFPSGAGGTMDGWSDMRLMAMQQAMRAMRGAPAHLARAGDPLQAAIYEVLEANAADHALIQRFPGLTDTLHIFRRRALRRRPTLNDFPPARRPLEQWLREILEAPPCALPPAPCWSLRGTCGTPRTNAKLAANPPAPATIADSPLASLDHARALARRMFATVHASAAISGLLFRDVWTGELRVPAAPRDVEQHGPQVEDKPSPVAKPPRSAQLLRRPQIREADERDEHADAGAWMVQTAQPLEHAEDPFGMQRPVDRDEQTPAEELADSVSELSQARLVSTPGSAREILLADDPLPARARVCATRPLTSSDMISYPEWNWRRQEYRDPGAHVHLLPAAEGTREWLEHNLELHRGMLDTIRRQFEALRPQRSRLRQQADGDELDLEACIDGAADALAGAPMPAGLYQTTRRGRRDMAALLLIDVSGSTDGWISRGRRVIDVEREALLLVSLAMHSLGEPYAMVAFSGEGPGVVTMRTIKTFRESYGEAVALRIAGLEPERYTRAGAAIRHASSLLMEQAAAQRLLLILSDGKPNDIDEYEGRYGVEDMRQAVMEARLQGIFPFCLTIDRQGASYLPTVFGEHQYALLHRPELLPNALLGWLRRLVKA